MNLLQEKIFKLKGKVQHYAWGGKEFIPHWLGIKNAEHKPFAEYWMGAHPSASSTIITNEGEFSLHELIKENPQELLGKKVQKQFGELPYLFKILDVKEMLSIQVHPSKTEAAKGFEAEEAAGVLLNAPHRNYKDKNHKPEVMIALSEFWLLHGFLPWQKLKDVLNEIPEFKSFKNIFQNDNYKNLYEYVMNLPQKNVDELLMPLVKRELLRKKNNELKKHEPGWWVAKLFKEKDEIKNIDKGIFSLYFFNIVKANCGEAVFQKAGIPHAYLEGQNVELMANSDNVLRGGLTPKHVDVPELIKHTFFEGIVPNIMKGEVEKNGEQKYACPVPDFGISKINLNAGETLNAQTSSLEIWVIMEGNMQLKGTNELTAKKGEAVCLLPNENVVVTAFENTTAYKAFVP
ncbi:MAG: mannose-6-phosphate isomerase, class I [Chitinophagaceae bacterium]